MRGGERVLEQILQIYPDADLYSLLHIQGAFSKFIEDRKIVTSFIDNLPFLKTKYRHYLPLFPLAARELSMKLQEEHNKQRYDLVFSTSHCVVKGVKAPKGVPHISYLHTPMRYVWDMFDDYFGKGKTSNINRLAMTIVRPYLQYWDKLTSKNVNHIITNSRFVKERIIKCYGRVDVTVIYPPVNLHNYRPYSNKEDFYLIVSAFAPYKRLDIAIEAFNRLNKRLVIIGVGQEEKKLKSIAGSTIEFKGLLSDDEISSYYQRARAFIFPGIEDFGITPLEAMASGTPVIAINKGGVTETVTSNTGLFFDEQTPESIMKAVKKFEEQSSFEQEKLVERAKSFSNERFKNEISHYVDTALKPLVRDNKKI